jgi:hypothetical protein
MRNITLTATILSILFASFLLSGCKKPEDEVKIARYHSGMLRATDSTVKIPLPSFEAFNRELAFVKLTFTPALDSAGIYVTGQYTQYGSGIEPLSGCYSVFEYRVDLTRIQDTVVFAFNKKDKYISFRYVLSY